jgi:hypothetical protein
LLLGFLWETNRARETSFEQAAEKRRQKMVRGFLLGRRQWKSYGTAVVLFGMAAVAGAQLLAPVAPVPPALFSAKTVFVSNAGADSGLFPQPFTGSPDRAYNEFYAAIAAWGQYRIVSTPAQADLILELQLTAPNGPTNPNKSEGASDPLPMFRLVIYDRASHFVLWALTESIHPAALQKTHDRNFDEALSALMSDLNSIVQAARASQS